MCKDPNYYQTLYQSRYNLCDKLEDTAIALREKIYQDTVTFIANSPKCQAGNPVPMPYPQSAGDYLKNPEGKCINPVFQKGMTPALSMCLCIIIIFSI